MLCVGEMSEASLKKVGTWAEDFLYPSHIFYYGNSVQVESRPIFDSRKPGPGGFYMKLSPGLEMMFDIDII